MSRDLARLFVNMELHKAFDIVMAGSLQLNEKRIESLKQYIRQDVS